MSGFKLQWKLFKTQRHILLANKEEKLACVQNQSVGCDLSDTQLPLTRGQPNVEKPEWPEWAIKYGRSLDCAFPFQRVRKSFQRILIITHYTLKRTLPMHLPKHNVGNRIIKLTGTTVQFCSTLQKSRKIKNCLTFPIMFDLWQDYSWICRYWLATWKHFWSICYLF